MFFKKMLNKILSLFPIPKIDPVFYEREKFIKEMALIGEKQTDPTNTETPDVKLPEELIKRLENIKKDSIKIFINGEEIKTKGVANGNNKNVH